MKQLSNKIINKLKREVLHTPVVSGLIRHSYYKKIVEYRDKLPQLNDGDRHIVNTLKKEGVVLTTFNKLSSFTANKIVDTATRLLSEAIKFEENGYSQTILASTLKKHPDIVRWGLDESLLDIVENYLGLPVYYLGSEVKRELANGKSCGVRKWHLDTEDRSMVKIIVYLSDVNRESTPFEYISRTKTAEIVKKLRYKSGLVSDETITRHIDSQYWIACMGAKYTIIIADTANVFHRVKPSQGSDRLSITYHYTSQYPIHLRSTDFSICTTSRHLYGDLSARQLNCLFPL